MARGLVVAVELQQIDAGVCRVGGDFDICARGHLLLFIPAVVASGGIVNKDGAGAAALLAFVRPIRGQKIFFSFLLVERAEFLLFLPLLSLSWTNGPFLWSFD
jgi:hypothetical protein